jgi:hypothetical protein
MTSHFNQKHSIRDREYRDDRIRIIRFVDAEVTDRVPSTTDESRASSSSRHMRDIAPPRATHFDKKPAIFFKAINCRFQASLIRRSLSCAAIDAKKASGKNQRRSALIGPDKGRQHREGRRNLGDFDACGVGR